MLSTVHKRPRSVFTSDAEEHTRFRRMLSKPFTFKRVEALRPVIQQITDQHIDALLAGPQPADIVTALALPVPSLVISQLLGVPYEDAGFFQHHANVGLARYATGEDTAKGAAGLSKYLAKLVETKMESPLEEESADAVSDLAERVKAGELSVREAAQLGTGLLIAGHETTANMLGLGVLALLEHPEQLAVIRDADDPSVIANAVEELLRYLSIIQNGQRRVAIEDIEIAAKSSARARESLSTWPRRTGMPASSTNPSGCTCTAPGPDRTWHSDMADINAWASNLPARSCRSSTTRCSAASPR
jgi:cytochrome P450